jgi:hypothetical protein
MKLAGDFGHWVAASGFSVFGHVRNGVVRVSGGVASERKGENQTECEQQAHGAIR